MTDELPVRATLDYLSVLGEAEIVVITEATQLLRYPAPITEFERDARGRDNLRHQDSVNHLRANVDHARNARLAKLLQQERTLLAAARDERVTSREERQVFCYGNPVWRDHKTVVDQLTIVSRRLESLEWMLKSDLTLLSAKSRS